MTSKGTTEDSTLKSHVPIVGLKKARQQSLWEEG